MATIDEKIKTIETKLKQAKAKKQKMEGMKRASEMKAQRAQDTRKKILLGAYVLEEMQHVKHVPSLYKYSEKTFDSWLVRDDDRALFGLTPMVVVKP